MALVISAGPASVALVISAGPANVALVISAGPANVALVISAGPASVALVISASICKMETRLGCTDLRRVQDGEQVLCDEQSSGEVQEANHPGDTEQGAEQSGILGRFPANSIKTLNCDHHGVLTQNKEKHRNKDRLLREPPEFPLETPFPSSEGEAHAPVACGVRSERRGVQLCCIAEIVCVVWESYSKTHQAEFASELFGVSFKLASSRMTHISRMKFTCRRQGRRQSELMCE